MTPNCYLSCGTVFKLMQAGAAQTAWNKTVLANFTGGSDGDLPWAGLISYNQSLYGTTSGLSGGAGAVFRVTGHTLTSIWTFTGGSDGARPFAQLIADDSGALYGTTGNGGTLGNGVVFKLTPPKFGQISWNLEPIWTFTGGADGSEPDAALIFDKSGALYGTTYEGGFQNNGVVFKLTPPKFGQTAWTDTTLWTFSGGSDGSDPYSPLIADGRGAIYGTTDAGGSFSALCSFGCGVVFKLTGTGFVPGRSD